MSLVDFTGIWKCVKTENLDDYLKGCGLGYMARKVASTAIPTIHIEQNENEFHIITKTLIKNIDHKFTIDTDYVSFNPMAAKDFKYSPCWDGKKLVIKAVPASSPEVEPQTVIRELLDTEEMFQEMISMKDGKEFICKRWFKK